MQVQENELYQRLIIYSETILKLYNELSKLDIQGKSNSEEYQTIKNYIRITRNEEIKIYTTIKNRKDLFESFNDKFMTKFEEVQNDFGCADVVFDYPNLLPFFRIEDFFIKYGIKSDYINDILPRNMSQLEKNLYYFNTFIITVENKLLAQSLKKEMNNFSHNDIKYLILNKYYYHLIYKTLSLEEDFLSKENLEYSNTIQFFLNNVQTDLLKKQYLKLVYDLSIDSIDSVIENIANNNIPSTVKSTPVDFMPLYYIFLDNCFSVLPKEMFNDAINETFNLLDQHFPENNDQILIIKKSILDSEIKKIIKKHQ